MTSLLLADSDVTAQKPQADGTAGPSFVNNALQHLSENPQSCWYTEEEVMNTAASMYAGVLLDCANGEIGAHYII